MMPEAEAEIHALLYREAKLLDARDYKAWLDLFGDPCRYWIPAAHHAVDPRRHVSIINDDREALAQRVERLGTRFVYAQTPPSRTARAVSNIMVDISPDSGEARAESVLSLFELRYGEQSLYPARCNYVLGKTESDGWRIKEKTVWLLAAEEPLRELAFLV